MQSERYTIEQRVFMVLQYEKTSNATEVQRRYRKQFQSKDAPSIPTIKRQYDNFVATGSVQDHYKGTNGPEETVITEENIQRVKDHFTRNPKCSIHQAASVLNLSYYAVQKILTKKNRLLPVQDLGPSTPRRS